VLVAIHSVSPAAYKRHDPRTTLREKKSESKAEERKDAQLSAWRIHTRRWRKNSLRGRALTTGGDHSTHRFINTHTYTQAIFHSPFLHQTHALAPTQNAIHHTYTSTRSKAAMEAKQALPDGKMNG
jgi:hypothetical protein